MKTAREVIADSFSSAVDPFCDDICPADFADEVARMLDEEGFVIAPKDPDEGMIFSGAGAMKEYPSHLGIAASLAYRAMISHYESRNGVKK